MPLITGAVAAELRMNDISRMRKGRQRYAIRFAKRPVERIMSSSSGRKVETFLLLRIPFHTRATIPSSAPPLPRILKQ